MKNGTVQEIAEALGAEWVGDGSFVVRSVAEPQNADPQDLALAMESKYEADLRAGNAEVAVIWKDADWQGLGLKAAIFAPRSRYVLSGVSYLFEQKPEIADGIHPTAVIDPSAEIGANAAIGPFVVIGSDVKIGDNARVMAHCTIGRDAQIGADLLLYPGVHIGERVSIGDGFISQSGTVVGADGFSYVTPQPGAVEEARATGKITEASRTAGFARINSLGSVAIGDRVEMGANCSIDRGTIANTEIGSGTKLDNQVHIGHNVRVGETCLLCGQVGIAGSTVVGDRVVMGGQVGVADHLKVGSDVVIAGKSGVSSNVPAGRLMMGNPAMKMELNVESYKALRRLPRWLSKFDKLEEMVSKLAKGNSPDF